MTDNLFSAGAIPSNSIGILFEPATSQSAGSGELTWGKYWNIIEELGEFILVLGGVDSSKFTGQIKFVLADAPCISPSLTYTL